MRMNRRCSATLCAIATSAMSVSVFSPSAFSLEPSSPCATGVPSAAGPRLTQEQSHYRARLHSLATGAGIKVAVIDTGVSPHEQLATVHPGADFIAPEEPEPWLDCDMHGTVVSGIIAGHDIGIAPHAELYSIRQTSTHYRHFAPAPPAEGGDSAGGALAAMSGNLDTLAAAIMDAVAAQARVINISVVSCLPADHAERLDTTGLDSALLAAEEAGAVVVAASGNASSGGCAHGDTVYPAHGNTVLAVGATQDAHTLAEYSIRSGEVALSADGHPPLVLNPAGGWATAKRDNGQDMEFHGTSFAAPVVAATVALLAQRYPEESPAQLRARIYQTARPSHGFIDPLAALTQVPAEYTVPAREKVLTHAAATPTPVPARMGLMVLTALGLLTMSLAWLGWRRAARS